MKIGIYKITNLINGKFYIGSSSDIIKRWNYHKWLLNSNRHMNKHLQNAWNKYGSKSFLFEVVELCEIEDLISLEQKYINQLSPHYNISPTAGNNTGFKHSDETKEKIRKANIEQWNNPNIRKKRLERLYTPELNISRSNALRGRKISDEHRQKISKSNKGKKWSVETLIKQKEVQKGKKRPLSFRIKQYQKSKSRARGYDGKFLSKKSGDISKKQLTLFPLEVFTTAFKCKIDESEEQ